jgi:hypothetical protein
MEIKDLFDPAVKQDILERINNLTATSERKWGKMDVAQMLAHLQPPIEVAYGTRIVKGNFLIKLMVPLFKNTLYNEKPWKTGLPTDKSFIMTGEAKDFESEKNKLLGLVEKFCEPAVRDTPHPVFGKMTKKQWSNAAWKHIDHHLRQFGA